MNCGSISIQNKRPQNYDQVTVDSENNFYAIFDGHGGLQVSKFLSDNYKSLIFKSEEGYQSNISSALSEMNAGFHKNQRLDKVGSTVSIVQILESKIITTTIGDSQTLVFDENFAFKNTPIHKPESEKRRLLAGKYQISSVRGPGRLGGIAVSRSMGDRHFHSFGLIAEPEIQIVEKSAAKFVFIACDGVFDVYKPGLIADMLQTYSRNEIVNVNGSRAKTLQCFLALTNQDFKTALPLLKSLGGYPVSSCWVDFNKNREDIFCQLVVFMLSYQSAMDNLSCILISV